MADQNSTTQTTPDASAGDLPASFEAFLEAQPEPIKALYTAHSESLLNTVKATRSERDTLARELKTAAAKLTEGSEARKQLDELSAKLETTERRASFLEDALRPEVQCKNAKAAWTLASAEGLFDKHGKPDWNAIKAEAPELFGPSISNANAGNGTGTKPPAAHSMNDLIRSAAGR